MKGDTSYWVIRRVRLAVGGYTIIMVDGSEDERKRTVRTRELCPGVLEVA